MIYTLLEGISRSRLSCISPTDPGQYSPYILLTMSTYHLSQASRRDDISGVHQSIEMPRRLLDRLPHLIITIQVKHIGDQIQRILVILNFGVQTSKVESVGQVIFVNFAEIFVASRGDELNNSNQ